MGWYYVGIDIILTIIVTQYINLDTPSLMGIQVLNKFCIVKISNLTFPTKGELLFDNLTVDLSQRGKLYFLVGKNGSGKSTLLKIFANIIQKGFKGRIDKGSYSKIGYVLDQTQLYEHLSGIDNIFIFNENPDSKKVSWLISKFEMDDHIKKKVKKMSLGMKAKTSLICTLSSTLDLLILDEPLNGFDDDSRKSFFSVIDELYIAKNNSVLIALHPGDNFFPPENSIIINI